MTSFDRRIAAVETDDGRSGYLLVMEEMLRWSDGDESLSVDIRVLLDDGTGGWSFSDRSDPDGDDSISELTAGRISWFGMALSIVEWVGSLGDGSFAARQFE